GTPSGRDSVCRTGPPPGKHRHPPGVAGRRKGCLKLPSPFMRYPCAEHRRYGIQRAANSTGDFMPEKKTLERARKDAREGKAPSTQAGEFVREEMEHIREGKHGARSTKQAIAIGLSKARRAGVNLPPPSRGRTSRRTRQSAARAYAAGQSHRRRKPSPRRS